MELALITGQHAAETRSKKSISNFVAQGPGNWRKVLRGERMYEFLERLIKAALPRIRDFRGVSPRGFDGHGNYTMGVSDQSIFLRSSSIKSSATSVLMLLSCTTARTKRGSQIAAQRNGMLFSDRAKAGRASCLIIR